MPSRRSPTRCLDQLDHASHGARRLNMDESAFRELISGERSGVRASLVRAGLSGLSVVYGVAVGSRNIRFDRGLHVASAPVPVVSVGNITTGGTGKTPFVALLANWFAARRIPAALLSRGYRALPGEANDEKLLLDRLCPGVPHLQSPNRVQSARAACTQQGARLLILDDGFQHRRLARDLDIVLIDALNPWGYDRLLPRGLLREPVSSLRRADVIVITRTDQCSREGLDSIVERVALVRGTDEHVEVTYPAKQLVNRAGETAPLESLRGRRVTAFCGIGNPEGFERTVREAGLALSGRTRFPDHHHYAPDDCNSLAQAAAGNGAEAVVTTEKDLVKIDRTELGGRPLWAVRIAAEVVWGRDLLEQRLENVLRLGGPGDDGLSAGG